MQTGQRGTQPVSPRDITGRRMRQLLREKAERDQAAGTPVDAIRRESFKSGFDAAWEPAFLAGWNALAEILTDAGVGVDAVLALGADDAGEAEEDVE
jgi:hypothetical protein